MPPSEPPKDAPQPAAANQPPAADTATGPSRPINKIRQTKVDLGGLMMVLADHLYSTPAVALRELVQNAHDSCRRRELEAGSDFDARITVEVDAAARTLVIEDNGAGLTDDEIDRYLATVGSGYTRRLREAGVGGSASELIGYFGLGFLSAFVIAERVEVWTASYQDPARAWRFASRSGQSYTVEPAEARPIGSRVTLFLSPKHATFADARAIRGLLRRYCCLLAVPIHFPQGSDDGAAINAEPPPWREAEERSELRRRTLEREFAARFAGGLGPLCTLPLRNRGAGPGSDVRGLLWIHEATTYGSNDNRQIAVFVRGMLIDPDERDLLPRWAGFVGAVVESDALAPTASREDLQRDEAYAAAQAAIHDALIDGLATLARREPGTWRRVLLRHNEALLGAAISDPRLFDLLADELTVPTTQGDLAVATVLRRGGGKIHVSRAERGGFEELLFRALKVPVVVGTRYGALPFCREYIERSGRGGKLVILGSGDSEDELFERVDDVLPAVRARLEAALGGRDYELILARFAPPYLPFVGVPDREVELKRRIESDKADARIGAAVLSLARRFTQQVEERPPLRVYVNAGCPAIAALLAAPKERGARAAALLRPLLALLSETDDSGRIMPIDEALETYCAAVVELLEGDKQGRGEG
ncbi:MAG: ATP-binding protein [Myxococcales bacterium]|nr:ATP-binding protein [Myxococcales bacterium]